MAEAILPAERCFVEVLPSAITILAPGIKSREASSECQWEASIRLGHLVLCDIRESALHVLGAGATMQAPSAVGQNLWVQPREVSCAGG